MITTSGNMQKTSPYLPIFGSVFAVSLLVLIYYERKRKLKEEFKENNGEGDAFNDKNEKHETYDIHGNEDKERKQENTDDATPSPSQTSYSSLEDDSEMQSCQATDSSTSAYSTASDDTIPFPVGEYSTYKQQKVDKDLTDMDFQEMLNSPVVESHCIDERMKKSPNRHCSEFAQFDNSMETTNVSSTVESTNVKSIIVAYSDIVPPLCPNTGDTIRPSKISNE